MEIVFEQGWRRSYRGTQRGVDATAIRLCAAAASAALSFHPDESFKIELETGVKLDGRSFEIDLLLTGAAAMRRHRIAIEMKCYRTLAASGDPRGATDIFMKDVYEDLYITERYVDAQKAE